MEKPITNSFDENKTLSSNSIIKMPHQNLLKSDILMREINSPSISTFEAASCKSPMLTVGSSEYSFVEIDVPNPVIVKIDPVVSPTAKISSSESVMELTKSRIGDEELLDTINMQMEETKEMLDMISRTKGKLEFFVFHVEYLVESLHEISNHSAASNNRGNTYIKNMYRKKLEEFASGLLDKVKKSIKDFESDSKLLKEQEKKTAETFEKITESHRSFDSFTAEIGKKTLLKENVDELAEEICSLIPKQLSKIDKVSYIETDIEMLYDLYRRFSSIEDPDLINF